MMVVMMSISTTPFNILFEKMGDILFSFVMGAPCRLFKSKSPTTLHQENKHVLIDKSYDISSVFFSSFLLSMDHRPFSLA